MIAPLSASSSTLNQPPAPQQQARSDGDSDSDWDDDDDFVAKKINIKIKPITAMSPGKVSASMDELRATVGTWKSMGNINLTKPNSRRSQHLALRPPTPSPLPSPPSPRPQLPATASLQQHQQTPQLQPTLTQLPVAPQTNETHLLPVALAVQECLNVRTLLGPGGQSSTSLTGHVRMAVPRHIVEMDEAQFEDNNLVLDMSAPSRWSDVRLNERFVRESGGGKVDLPNGTTRGNFYLDPMDPPLTIDEQSNDSQPKRSNKKITVDMKTVYNYSREMLQARPAASYILQPELLTYQITQPPDWSAEEDRPKENGNGHNPSSWHSDSPCLNPVQPVAHWLCDLSVTKVRVDFECLLDKLAACDLWPMDVRNIKISLQVDGGVESQQSKPPAVWSPIDSKLTWSFNDLGELIDASSQNGVTSCLAKLNLRDGPSTPDVVDLQFSIPDRTLSGTQITLASSSEQKFGNPSYRISKQKLETRTGRFRCEPPCDSAVPLLT